MNNLKEKLNKIYNSKTFVIVLGSILLIKTIAFYTGTIDINKFVPLKTIFGTIIIIATVGSFLVLLPNKIRIITTIILDLLLSVLLLIDHIYYIYSSNVVTVAQISNLQYTEQILDTIPSLFKLKYLLYFFDVVLIIILVVCRILKIEKQEKNDREIKKRKIFAITVGLITFILICVGFIDNASEKSWNREEQIESTTIYGYHIFDIINTITYKNRVKYSEYDEMIKDYDELKQDFENDYGKINYDFGGILDNKNVLIVQLESIQQFVAHLKIDGKEITPNINRFLDENIEFKNMHMQSYSSTADAEFATITSVYPMENGMSYSKHFTNTYDDIFKMFNRKDYYTSYMHGNIPEFWNRGNVYSRMEIDSMSFINNFEDTSEMINSFLSDELFYRQAVEKISKQEKPFMTYLVAASSHTPFDLDGIQDRDKKISIDVGKLKDTYLGNYLESVNYADYAFGIFVDELKSKGLYDDTAIIIFGDHNGLDMWNEELREFLKQYNPNLIPIDQTLTFSKTVCAMKLPGVNKHLEIDKRINKLDIKPTLAYLCNLEEGFSLGTNAFASKDFVCLNNEKIIAQEYYYDKEWYRISDGEPIDLKDISEDLKSKLDKYVEYMKRELDISFSLNINNLLKQRR